MSRPFLFGGNAPNQSSSRYLVEFRAGKMTQNGTTVSPVKNRKGTVYLHQSAEDSLMHFCWKDRQTGQVEDDLIIFPDEAEFKKVTQCTTGRVFILKFKANPSRKYFYWMQEPKDNKDEEHCNKINEYINNPPAPGSRAGGGGLSSGNPLSELSGIPDGDLQGLLNNMSPQQIMSVLNGVGGISSVGSLASLLGAATRGGSSGSGTSAPQTPTPTPSGVSAAVSESNLASSSANPAIQLSDLQNIISGLTVPQQEKDESLNVDLSSSITMDVLQPLLSNEEFMTRVRETLPPNASEPQLNPSDHFVSTVQSPQFQQALSTFSAALQSGQLGPLIQQFGLGQACVDAANSGDLESFVKALQQQQQSKKSEKTNDKDDEMALD